ncbi:MAG: hypothetical protein VYA27_04005 [Verrucomicrobiota bacterium]|nr:hypothetical protein [Verrucomicrobiota bacterium]
MNCRSLPLLVALTLTLPSFGDPGRKPNFILCMADDLGWETPASMATPRL